MSKLNTLRIWDNTRRNKAKSLVIKNHNIIHIHNNVQWDSQYFVKYSLHLGELS